MNFNDAYYEPPTDRAWDAFCDEYDPDTHGEDMESAFDEWMQEQEDRAEDAAIERAESAREDY